MTEITAQNLKQLPLTTRLIAKEALGRGWKVRQLIPPSPLIELENPSGSRQLIYSSTPEGTSFIAHYIAENKFATYRLLADKYPMPRTAIADTPDAARQAFVEMLGSGTASVVVKPFDGAHGSGITTDITSADAFEAALERAFKRSKKVVIQEFLVGYHDLRITIINGAYAAALLRKPAAVVGDGHNSIARLIEIENDSGRRGTGYSKPLNRINMAAAKVYLGSDIDDVPAKGRSVVVVGTANLGSGGETSDITDTVPRWLIQDCERIAEQLSMPVVAVDVMVKKLPSPAISRSQMAPSVIEVNKCPALFMHEMPTSGKPRAVIKKYLDYLESNFDDEAPLYITKNAKKAVIGRSEAITVNSRMEGVPAKIDSGAFSSVIHASDITVTEENGSKLLRATLLDHPACTAEPLVIEMSNFTEMSVYNSFGHSEKRYVVELSVTIAGREVISDFTLTDRSHAIFPVLVGRKVIKNGFVVDVTKTSLNYKKLHKLMPNNPHWLKYDIGEES